MSAACERDGSVVLAPPTVTVGAGYPIEGSAYSQCCSGYATCEDFGETFNLPCLDSTHTVHDEMYFNPGREASNGKIVSDEGLWCLDCRGPCEDDDLGGCVSVEETLSSSEPDLRSPARTCWTCYDYDCECFSNQGVIYDTQYPGCGSFSVVFGPNAPGYSTCSQTTVTPANDMTCWQFGGTDCTTAGYYDTDQGGCTQLVSSAPDDCIAADSKGNEVREGTTCWACYDYDCECFSNQGVVYDT